VLGPKVAFGVACIDAEGSHVAAILFEYEHLVVNSE